jgi:hypothetical protein
MAKKNSKTAAKRERVARKPSAPQMPSVDMADEKLEKPKAVRPPGVKAQVRALLLSGEPFTIERLLRKTAGKEVTLRTAISDLKSDKYAGAGGALKIITTESGAYTLAKEEIT